MSKASEWAQADVATAGIRPHDFYGLGITCRVGRDKTGNAVCLVNGREWTPEQAVALARWLVDVFGDSQ